MNNQINPICKNCKKVPSRYINVCAYCGEPSEPMSTSVLMVIAFIIFLGGYLIGIII